MLASSQRVTASRARRCRYTVSARKLCLVRATVFTGAILDTGSGGHLKEAAYVGPLLSATVAVCAPRGLNGT